MKILITGMKASGKSFLHELIQETQPFINYDTFVIDGELFSNYNQDGNYQVDMTLASVITNVISKHSIVFGAVIIANMVDFDRVIYLKPSYNDWLRMIKKRVKSGRQNSAKAHESDVELTNYSYSQFKTKMNDNIKKIVNQEQIEYRDSYSRELYEELISIMSSK